MQHNHSEIKVAGGGALRNRSQAEKVTYKRDNGGDIQTELSVGNRGKTQCHQRFRAQLRTEPLGWLKNGSESWKSTEVHREGQPLIYEQ